MRRRRPEVDSRDTDDDGELIARSVRQPDRFAVIFDRHAGHIHRYLSRRLGAQIAEDLVAETFLLAFGKRKQYDTTRHDARPWLYGIATKLVAQHGRDEERAYRLRVPGAGRDEQPCHADRVAEDVTAQALRDVLATALAELSTGDRDVLLLIAQEELTYEQVAVALDIPIGTVRSRLNRARAQLRHVLGGTNPALACEETRHG